MSMRIVERDGRHDLLPAWAGLLLELPKTGTRHPFLHFALARISQKSGRFGAGIVPFSYALLPGNSPRRSSGSGRDRVVTTRVLNLGSGSSGNALLIEDAGLRLLVDCGVGPRTITAALKTFNLAWGDLDLVLI